MTNAEKLAKDTEFMADSIILYCYDTNCQQCRFAEIKGTSVCCKIAEYAEGTFRNGIKKWLEREAEEK